MLRNYAPLERIASLKGDAHFVARALRRNPGFAVVALLSAALGIGVNSAIFALFQAFVLDTLPMSGAGRVAAVDTSGGMAGGYSNLHGYAAFREIAAKSDLFEAATAQAARIFDLQTPSLARRVDGLLVSGSYFSFLGATPLLGRLLTEQDDAQGSDPVCVIGYRLWSEVFHGDPTIVGRSIRVDGRSLEVIGVTRPEFTGLGLQDPPDMEVPTAANGEYLSGMRRDRPGVKWLAILVLLKRGITAGAASVQLTELAAQLEPAVPRSQLPAYRVVMAPRGLDPWGSRLGRPAAVLLCAVLTVLVIACLNLTNLFLARAQDREREIALRLALGSTKAGIFRVFLLESAAIVAAGCAIGWLVSQLLTGALVAEFNKGKAAGLIAISNHWQVLLFAASLGAAMSLVLASGPAWLASGAMPIVSLRGSQPGALIASAGARLRRGLLFVQITLTMVLVMAAGTFGRSLRNLRLIDVGTNPDTLILIRMTLAAGGQPLSPPGFLDDLLARVRQMPSVRSAAYGTGGVISGAQFSGPVQIPGDQLGSGRRREAFNSYVGPGYFYTVGIPVLAGREFNDADNRVSPSVAVVNQAFANTYFPGGNPLGRSFSVPGADTTPAVIVGVVRNMPYFQLRDTQSASVFRLMRQGPDSWARLIVRSAGEPPAIGRDVRSLIHALAPRLPIDQVETLANSRDAAIARERMLAVVSALFALLALVLAAAGAYGLTAYSVARRTLEIGVRVALGAQPFDVIWLFVRENLRLIVAGLLAGLLIALAAARSIRSLLYGVPSTDWASLALAGLALVVVSLTATLIPLLRSLALDPARALRDE